MATRRSALDRSGPGLTITDLTMRLSRHERYHAAVDELALAQDALVQSALKMGVAVLGEVEMTALARRVSEWSGKSVRSVRDIDRDFRWCGSRMLEHLASRLRGRGEPTLAAVFRNVADVAHRAERASRPQISERDFEQLIVKLQARAAELRGVAGLLAAELKGPSLER